MAARPGSRAMAGTGISRPPTMPPSSPARTGEDCRGPHDRSAATTPKTNCETMNQGQSTPLHSTGLTTPIRPKLTAVQTAASAARPRPAAWESRQRRQQHAVDQAEDHRHDGVNDDAQRAAATSRNCSSSAIVIRRRPAAPCRPADSPDTRCRGRSRGRRPGPARHHQAADDAPLDAGRDRMDLHRQPQPIAGHARSQLLHGPGPARSTGRVAAPESTSGS